MWNNLRDWWEGGKPPPSSPWKGPEKLILYHMPFCPYCVRVFRYLEKKGIAISMKNIQENAGYRQELIQIGGKGQVPCLLIDGKPLYESLDIIAWFESRL